mgnify:CR=1 FL=1|jgi:hypothetical protein
MLNGNRLNSLDINGPELGLRKFVQTKWTISTDLNPSPLMGRCGAANFEVNTALLLIGDSLSLSGLDAPTYRTLLVKPAYKVFNASTTPITTTQLEYAA